MPLLLIIDMQVGMTWPRFGERNNPQAEAHIAALLAHWRQAGAPVVHVRHLSRTPDSVFWPGQPGAAFQPALAPLEGEHVVEKNVPDAFALTGLERWLHVRGHRELVIVGVSTNHSVEATARSAGNLGFLAHVVAEACFAYELTDLRGQRHPAEEVHQMALANLHGEYATVIDMAAAQMLASAGSKSRHAPPPR